MTQAAEEEQSKPLPCADKQVFGTPREARAAATVAEHRYGGKLQAYRCRHCGLWHLASRYPEE